MGEGRGAAVTSHGHKLAMVSETTFDCISLILRRQIDVWNHTFFGILQRQRVVADEAENWLNKG